MRVGLICFANTCRSPVAEALLRVAVPERDGVSFFSRGIVGDMGPRPSALEVAAEEAGLVLPERAGEVLDREAGRAADLMLFMERSLLREAVVADRTLWPKSFTLLEFARRAFTDPPDRESEGFEQWRALLHSKRRAEDLLQPDGSDDIADPGLGGRREDYATMIEDLRAATGRVAPFLTGWSAS